MASTGRLPLATAERVVDRVHGDTTGLGPDSLPTIPAGLADLDQLGLGVPHRTECSPAVDRDPPHLGRRQPESRENALLRDQLHAHAGTAGEFAALAGTQLDVVDGRTDRDVAQRERVPRADLRALPRLEAIADLDLGRRQDVALLAVDIVEQCDAG